MLHARERSSVQLSRGCYQRGHSKMKLLADPAKQVLNAENVPLERAKSTVPNVAHATLCQQESNGAGCKQTAGCRQFVSPFPPLRERADARIGQIPAVHARRHPCG